MASFNFSATGGAAPGNTVHSGNLECVIDTRGKLQPIPSFLPTQSFCFRSLNFIADQLGQLHLLEEGLLIQPELAGEPPCCDPIILSIDGDALACHINAHLEVNPEPEAF